MTEEQILGALLWSVWHNDLPDDLIYLADTLSEAYQASLEGYLEIMVRMTQGCKKHPGVRPDLIFLLKDEIQDTMKEQGAKFEDLLTPQRLIGALIWVAWNNQLPDELVSLAQDLPKDNLTRIIKTNEIDPASKPHMIKNLKEEIKKIMKR